MNMQTIKDRLAAITPGKWTVSPFRSDYGYDIETDEPRTDLNGSRGMMFAIEADAEFIANAPADIDALIARVEELEAALTQFSPINTLLMDIWDTAHSASIVNRAMNDPAQLNTLIIRIVNAANEAQEIAKNILADKE